jgi:TPR repeat protein
MVDKLDIASLAIDQKLSKEQKKLKIVELLDSCDVLYHNILNSNKDDDIIDKLYELFIEKKVDNDIKTTIMFNYIGTFYRINNDFTKATLYYKKAMNGKNEDAFNNIGRLYEYLNKINNAIDSYKTAIELGNVDAMINLGQLYDNMGDYKLAEKYFGMAASTGNEYATDTLHSIYIDQIDKIKITKAQQYFIEKIKKVEKKGPYLNELGRSYLVQNDIKSAEIKFKEAADLGEVDALFNLGNLYNDQGKYEIASEYFKKAAAKNHGGALNNLGAMSHEMGNLLDAEQYYRLAINAGDEDAVENLNALINEES